MSDPIEEYSSALNHLSELTPAIASQSSQQQVLDAITKLRLAVVRAYGGRRPRHPHGQGGRSLILRYLEDHLDEWVYGDELAAVSGIGEWARRVRELRVQDGYDIEEQGGSYRLKAAEPDRIRRDRWRIVGEIQEIKGDPKSRVEELLQRLRTSVVNVDELDRVAGEPAGARLARELRDDEGLPIENDADSNDLAPGEYRLASSREWARLEPAQRLFPEDLRRQLFKRDRFRCWTCKQSRMDVTVTNDDPFYLVVRHLDASNEGLFGLSAERINDLSKLATCCNRCSSGPLPS